MELLLGYSKQLLHEILRQMDGTRKYHPERGNSDKGNPKGHAWYILTNKWILAKKQNKTKTKTLQNTQDTINRTQEG